MTTMTITKSYTEIRRDYFTLYGKPSLKNTHVFWEYFHIFGEEDVDKNTLISIVKEYKPKSKASININYYEDRIEFLSNSVFPVFYVVFK